MSQYSLENLWNFSDTDIHRILQYFNWPITGTPTDKLAAVILSTNANLLNPAEKHYVTNPEFNRLFLASDQQLASIAPPPGPRSHINLIKSILDRSAPSAVVVSVPAALAVGRAETAGAEPAIPVVSQIPSNITQPLVLYQLADRLFLCGIATYPLREQLKSLGGIWNPSLKCWNFPLTAQNGLLTLVGAATPTPSAGTALAVEASIPSSIPVISEVPKRIAGGLQIYQMGGQLISCGSGTYNLNQEFRNLNGTWDSSLKCWTFPPSSAQGIINLKQQFDQRKSAEQQRLQQEQLLKTQTEAQRQAQLQISEPEATYIPHIRRIAPEIISQAYQNGTDMDLEYNMEQQDANELQQLWDDKIKIVRQLPGYNSLKAIVTYTGDLKPPDSAFVYAVNNWEPAPWGGSVHRTNYKTYRVDISTD